MGYLIAVLGGAQLNIEQFIFGYLIFAPAHLSVSFSNDFFDRYSDKNSDQTAFSGGSKVLVEHPELARFSLVFALVLLMISFVGAAIFILAYGYPYWFLFFVLLGGLLGWFYSAPPIKFSYRGWGEIATMIAVGILMPGMGYLVASGSIDFLFAIFILPLSCYGFFFIVTVELPDVESDKKAKKIGLPVKFGRKIAFLSSLLATIIGTILLGFICLSGFLEGKIDISIIVVLSSVLILVALRGAIIDFTKEQSLVKQVMLNMSAMLVFLFFMDLSLLLQLFSRATPTI